MSDVVLELEDVAVRYPLPRGLAARVRRRPAAAVHALDGVSLQVRAGELVALVGESGCGKSTTAQVALGLVRADAGTLRFEGEDVTDLPTRRLRALRRRAQLTFQDPFESLDPRFRVRGIVEEPLLIHGLEPSADARRARAVAALERAGLAPGDLFLDRRPHELSGGQRQRVALASSLVLEPRLLVADEPVSMLDVSVRAGVLGVLDALRADGVGILMITHDLSTAAQYADRILVMYLGRIVEAGPARQVVDDPQHPYTRALISVLPPVDPLAPMAGAPLRGEAPDPIDVPPGCRFHPRCPAAQDRCRREDPELRADRTPHAVACVRAPLAGPAG
jgi:peptide/nickel transport system ATP-binding protein